MSQSTVVDLAVQPSPSEPAPPDAIASFEEVYRREFDYVWHTLRRLGIPPRDLPDVTHDVFVVVYRCLAQYDPSRPLRPWLFGVSFRVASDHQRLSRNAREKITMDLEPHDQGAAADERLEDAQQRQLVHEALQTLDLDRRSVLIAHDIDEQPMREIARALGVPEKTLYSRLRVARESFVAAVRRIQLRRGER